MFFLDFSTVEKRSRDETRRHETATATATRCDATRCDAMRIKLYEHVFIETLPAIPYRRIRLKARVPSEGGTVSVAPHALTLSRVFLRHRGRSEERIT